MPKYVIVHGSIIRNKEVLSAGSVVEMTEEQALAMNASGECVRLADEKPKAEPKPELAETFHTPEAIKPRHGKEKSK